jgi:uncharacterized protein YidB (DUF937 family)
MSLETEEANMGLLDDVIGSVTGTAPSGSSSTSPLVKALLLLIAAKAFIGHTGSSAASSQPDGSAGAGRAASPEPAPESASGEISSGMLRGLPGLGAIVDRFTQNGFSDTVQSWIGVGQNRPIAPNDLNAALGPDVVNNLERQTGLSRDQLLDQLAQALPQVVDRLTPHGRIPTEHETAQR